MLKPFLLSKKWYYFTYCWEDKGIQAFPKGISPKQCTRLIGF